MKCPCSHALCPHFAERPNALICSEGASVPVYDWVNHEIFLACAKCAERMLSLPMYRSPHPVAPTASISTAFLYTRDDLNKILGEYVPTLPASDWKLGLHSWLGSTVDKCLRDFGFIDVANRVMRYGEHEQIASARESVMSTGASDPKLTWKDAY